MVVEKCDNLKRESSTEGDVIEQYDNLKREKTLQVVIIEIGKITIQAYTKNSDTGC